MFPELRRFSAVFQKPYGRNKCPTAHPAPSGRPPATRDYGLNITRPRSRFPWPPEKAPTDAVEKKKTHLSSFGVRSRISAATASFVWSRKVSAGPTDGDFAGSWRRPRPCCHLGETAAQPRPSRRRAPTDSPLRGQALPDATLAGAGAHPPALIESRPWYLVLRRALVLPGPVVPKIEGPRRG